MNDSVVNPVRILFMTRKPTNGVVRFRLTKMKW